MTKSKAMHSHVYKIFDQLLMIFRASQRLARFFFFLNKIKTTSTRTGRFPGSPEANLSVGGEEEKDLVPNRCYRTYYPSREVTFLMLPKRNGKGGGEISPSLGNTRGLLEYSTLSLRKTRDQVFPKVTL